LCVLYRQGNVRAVRFMDLANNRIDKMFCARILDDALCQLCVQVSKSVSTNDFVILNAETGVLGQSRAFADIPFPGNQTSITSGQTAQNRNSLDMLSHLNEQIEYARNLLDALVNPSTHSIPEARCLHQYITAVQEMLTNLDILDQNGSVLVSPSSLQAALNEESDVAERRGYHTAARALCTMIVTELIPFR
jgi:hypothetical protein